MPGYLGSSTEHSLKSVLPCGHPGASSRKEYDLASWKEQDPLNTVGIKEFRDLCATLRVDWKHPKSPSILPIHFYL